MRRKKTRHGKVAGQVGCGVGLHYAVRQTMKPSGVDFVLNFQPDILPYAWQPTLAFLLHTSFPKITLSPTRMFRHGHFDTGGGGGGKSFKTL